MFKRLGVVIIIGIVVIGSSSVFAGNIFMSCLADCINLQVCIFTVSGELSTGVVENRENSQFSILNSQFLAAYPNPFSTKITIQYSVASSQGKDKNLSTNYYLPSTIRIYDLSGRLVRTLVNEQRKIGYYTVTWDRSDDSGNKVANGIYFYKLDTGDYTNVKKLVILE